MGSIPYLQVSSFIDFRCIIDPTVYVPLPGDWFIGITDVVNSTSALHRGAYRAVNYAGAAALAAVANSIGSHDFPFSFSGDGASFAIKSQDRARAEQALADTSAWCKTNLDLILRAALIPISEIRANNYDVRVAKYATSASASYTMFSGGGVRWAESALKSGRFGISTTLSGGQPDLSGLSCNWAPVPSKCGAILSVLVEALPEARQEEFARLAVLLLAILEEEPGQGHPIYDTALVPVSKDAIDPRLNPSGTEGIRQPANDAAASIQTLDEGSNVVLGQSEMAVSQPTRSEIAYHSDYKKFDDVLRMTVDCSHQQITRIENLLSEAARASLIRYGMHRQREALLTCFIPSGETHFHLHFLDGADGGYASAAQNMKASQKHMADISTK